MVGHLTGCVKMECPLMTRYFPAIRPAGPNMLCSFSFHLQRPNRGFGQSWPG